MKLHANTKKLHDLMKRHRLTAPEVARLLGREANTVRVWRVVDTVRPIPDDTLKLLELLLGNQRRNTQRPKKAAPAKRKSSGKRS